MHTHVSDEWITLVDTLCKYIRISTEHTSKERSTRRSHLANVTTQHWTIGVVVQFNTFIHDTSDQSISNTYVTYISSCFPSSHVFECASAHP